jgi:hypothetical protein
MDRAVDACAAERGIQAGSLIAYTSVLFIVIMLRPTISPPRWGGWKDPRSAAAILTGVAILLVIAFLIAYFGLNTVVWGLLITFAFTGLAPITILLTTPDANHDFSAFLQRIFTAPEIWNDIWNVMMCVIPVTAAFAGGTAMQMIVSDDAGFALGIIVVFVCMAAGVLYVFDGFSSQSIVVWSALAANASQADAGARPGGAGVPYVPNSNQTGASRAAAARASSRPPHS